MRAVRRPVPLPSGRFLCLAVALAAATCAGAQPTAGESPVADTRPEIVALRLLPFSARADAVAGVRDLLVKREAQLAELRQRRERDATIPTARDAALDDVRQARIGVEHAIGKLEAAIAETWFTTRDAALDAVAGYIAATERATGS